jgi:hypothetical protein
VGGSQGRCSAPWRAQDVHPRGKRTPPPIRDSASQGHGVSCVQSLGHWRGHLGQRCVASRKPGAGGGAQPRLVAQPSSEEAQQHFPESLVAAGGRDNRTGTARLKVKPNRQAPPFSWSPNCRRLAADQVGRPGCTWSNRPGGSGTQALPVPPSLWQRWWLWLQKQEGGGCGGRGSGPRGLALQRRLGFLPCLGLGGQGRLQSCPWGDWAPQVCIGTLGGLSPGGTHPRPPALQAPTPTPG